MHARLVRTAPLLLAFVIGAACAADSVPAPSPARRVDIVDHLHGLTLPDPYRWMEGANNTEFQDWLKQQGDYTRARLDAQPQLPRWRERLKAVGGAVVLNRLQKPAGGRVFFLRLEGGHEGMLMVRDADGHERVLLDPNRQDGASVTSYSPSPDGTRVAVNVDHGGSELTRIEVLDVATAKPLADAVEPVWGEFNANWLPDGSGFTYTQMRTAAERGQEDALTGMRLRLHKLGTPVTDDPVLVTTGINPRVNMAANEFPSAYTTPTSPWALLVLGGARPEARVCVAPLAQALSAQAPWNCIAGYDDKIQNVDLHGSTLYLQSLKDTPNGRLFALDLSKPDPKLADAKVVLPESKDDVITNIAAARDALYVRRMRNGLDHIIRLEHDGTTPRELTLPFDGSAALFATDPQADGLLFTLQGWTRPRVAYHYAPKDDAITDLKLGGSSPADYSELESIETEAVSADGTHVPLSIIRRKDAKTDGNLLSILDGYGGYGISVQPFFDPTRLEWVKAGNVYAACHVRGGGEKGEAWHLGGKGANKHKGVEDFIACAQQLGKLGISRPGKISGMGASMGGVLMGGALTTAPQDFGAFVITAGVLNPVRLLEGQNGANQISEMGDPRTAEGLAPIAAMDPYQHVRDGVKYPPVLLMVGLNDQRVVPWHSGKFGARLQAVGAAPVWFRTDAGTGHFSTSMSEAANDDADVYTFIESQLR